MSGWRPLRGTEVGSTGGVFPFNNSSCSSPNFLAKSRIDSCCDDGIFVPSVVPAWDIFSKRVVKSGETSVWLPTWEKSPLLPTFRTWKSAERGKAETAMKYNARRVEMKTLDVCCLILKLGARFDEFLNESLPVHVPVSSCLKDLGSSSSWLVRVASDPQLAKGSCKSTRVFLYRNVLMRFNDDAAGSAQWRAFNNDMIYL